MAVRCGVLEHIGVVVRIEDEHVVVAPPQATSGETFDIVFVGWGGRWR